MDLNGFEAWAAAKPSRMVNIEMKTTEPFRPHQSKFQVTVWVYDYDLEVGQHVTSVEEIDLEGKQIREARKKIEQANAIIAKAEQDRRNAQAFIDQAKEGQHSGL